jgi:hypothetical protein
MRSIKLLNTTIACMIVAEFLAHHCLFFSLYINICVYTRAAVLFFRSTYHSVPEYKPSQNGLYYRMEVVEDRTSLLSDLRFLIFL